MVFGGLSVCENEESINANCPGECLVCVRGSPSGNSGPRAPSKGFSHYSPHPPHSHSLSSSPLATVPFLDCAGPVCCPISGHCTCVPSAWNIPLPGMCTAHSSLPAGAHGHVTFSASLSALSNILPPSPLFFFLNLIAMQLPVCCTYLSFY